MLVGVEHYYNGEYEKALVYVTMVIVLSHNHVIIRLLQDVAMRYQVERWPLILSEVLTRILRSVLSQLYVPYVGKYWRGEFMNLVNDGQILLTNAYNCNEATEDLQSDLPKYPHHLLRQ